jgi:hypothetical protein
MLNGLSQDEINAIKEKRWQIDFGHVEFVRNDGSHRIDGRGYIRMEADGGASFKLYPDQPLAASQGAKWFTEFHGRLIPVSRFYKLKGADSTGRTWEALNIMPHVQILSQGDQPVSGIIYGELKGSSESEHKYAKAHLIYKCFEKYDFQCNAVTKKYCDDNGTPVRAGSSLDTARFSMNDLDFVLKNENDQFAMTITSNNPYMPSIIESRSVEAMQFLLGCAIDWHILEKHENGNEYIKVRFRHAPTAAIHPPLLYRDPKAVDYWKMYIKYLEYICQNDDENSWHPISLFMHRIFEARKASIETQCLALAVVVEGLLMTEFKDLAKPSEELIHWIEQAKSLLSQSGMPEGICIRMAGAITDMKRASATGKLQELLNVGIITEKEKKTWTKLRNSSAHPKCAFFKDFEEAYYAFDTVLTLFYKLVLHRIGYCGKYTDYGNTSMDDKLFPPAT